jgi:DNA-binding LacI/PurR family transcriptional regulator
VVGVLSEEYVAALYKTGSPVLSVDIQYHSVFVGCVGTANIAGGAQAAEYLISQGHKNIGFIGPVYVAQSIYERWCGFKQALIHHGLEYREELCIINNSKNLTHFNDQEIIARLIDGINEYPTAWFCAGDLIAAAVINCLIKRGIRVPNDISIMGYDDVALSEMFNPRLTTMRVNREFMGQLAVRYLLGHYFGNGFSTNVELRSELVLRDSVKKITGNK